MPVLKIDHKVSWLIANDFADTVNQLKKSGRMYSWVKDEDIETLLENWAVANPHATLGDLMEWSKRTYMERLEAKKGEKDFANYKLVGDYNPTRPTDGTARKEELGRHGVTIIDDVVPAKLKQRPATKEEESASEMGQAKQRAEQKRDMGIPLSPQDSAAKVAEVKVAEAASEEPKENSEVDKGPKGPDDHEGVAGPANMDPLAKFRKK